MAAVAATANARNLYVDNVGGDDLLDGLWPQREDQKRGPNQTIWRALKSARPGDRIVLAKNDEPYRESISLVGSRLSGYGLRPLVIEGNGAALDGSQPVPFDAWKFVGGDVFRFQPPKKDFQQLFHEGVPLVRRPYSPFYNKKLELEPRQWALRDGWVYFRVEQGKLPEDYHLSYSELTVGITVYKVEGVVISNVIVQGFQLDGISLNDAVGPTILSGVTARGNGRSGVAVSGVSDVNLQGCLLGDNGHCQLLLQEFAEVNLANCDVVDNTAIKWEINDGAKLRVDGKAVSSNGK
jgi:hypothetical protein